jgi:hypothetical protein
VFLGRGFARDRCTPEAAEASASGRRAACLAGDRRARCRLAVRRLLREGRPANGAIPQALDASLARQLWERSKELLPECIGRSPFESLSDLSAEVDERADLGRRVLARWMESEERKALAVPVGKQVD